MKPTSFQLDVITRMRAAGRLVYVNRFWTTPGMTWSKGEGRGPDWSPDIATIQAMYRRGWIAKADPTAGYKGDWILTDAAPAAEAARPVTWIMLGPPPLTPFDEAKYGEVDAAPNDRKR